ncbi:ABC transporter permease [Butyricicoccus sp. 1XD8-22]|nr:ABC transporter permease [Butyricicoccus sp. 1XD8-22]
MANPQTASLSVADEFVQKIEQKNRKDRIIQLVPVFVLVGLYLVFAAVAPGFASLENLITMLGQTALPLTVALGITFVILTGCIDLSVDGVMSLGGCAVSMLVMNNMTSLSLGIIGVLASVAVCALIGFCIGLIHVKARIPSFMVSYGFSGIAAGVAMAVTGAVSPTIMDEGFRNLALSNFLGIPYTAWISFAVFAVAYIMQEYTAFGRYLFAVGNDESIPKVIGVNTQTVKLKAFAWSGALIGLAGVLGAARIGMGTTLIGKNNLFPAMTAVVLGGTSLSGGKGGVLNTLLGVLIVTELNNGLVLLGVSSDLQTGIQSLIILAAVALSSVRGRRVVSK